MVYNDNVFIFLPNIGNVMKKLLLVASCLFMSDSCKGCQKPQPLDKKYVNTVVAHQAMPYKFYELRDAELNRFMPIENCPVPKTPPKTPNSELIDGCPVPKTPPKTPGK